MAGKGMIEPFAGRSSLKGVVSFGVSAYGYDMRLSGEFLVFKPPAGSGAIDPKNCPKNYFKKTLSKTCLIPANSFILARSLEYFRIPRKVIAVCLGKSTYARCGVIVNITPLEPEWEGYVTICIANTSPRPVRIFGSEGIAQVLFFESDEECEISYADKKGKYQAQKSITRAKV